MATLPTHGTKKPTRREEQEQWRKQQENSNRQNIRFFLISLAMTPGQIALSAMGIGEPITIAISISFAVILIAFGFFYGRIVEIYPAVSERLRILVRPGAWIAPFLLFVAVTWAVDASVRWNTAAIPAGSFVSPEAKSQEATKFPLISTHARLQFPIGANRATPAGPQENIWTWTSTKSSLKLGGNRPVPELSVWSITVVFANETNVDNLVIHTLNAPGRPLPPYQILSKDSRTTFIQFRGELEGFIIDTTNQP